MNTDMLADGWTLYLWLVVGVLIIIAVIFGIRWAFRNEQFDEDIKYVMFNKDDEDKMSPEDYAKSQEVMVEQIQRRDELLRERANQK
ncbi:MAG: hypothetical protein ABIR48_04475 [Gammaproteobacteria bacterium]